GHGELKRLGGMYKAHPGLAALFFINALSIAGMPLLSGFWAKMALIRAGLETGAYVVVAASLVASLAGLAGMMKIWMEVFWKDRPESGRAAREPSAASAGAVAPPITTGRYRIPLMTTPAVVLTVITVTLGLAPGWLYGLSERAARQLSDREGYITAVLPPDYLDETRAQIAAIRAEREAFALASETAAQTADLAEEAAR
ncbi:MAG: proton-conducting transporter membrane subunit, partial [Planctomycetota bacterium]